MLGRHTETGYKAAMTLHLIKLAVGAESIDDMREWVDMRLRTTGEHAHTTRMVPKRADELTDGGSLYWVIKGQILIREAITAIRPFTDGEGISRCDIVLDGVLVPVEPRPRGPFQGWRYLLAHEAPKDLGTGATKGLPPELARELSVLGLL